MSVLYKDKGTGNWEKVGGIAITGFVSGLPDWDNAVEVTADQINAGYTCPDNGLLVGTVLSRSSSSSIVYVNGIGVSNADTTESNPINVPVQKGDIVSVSEDVAPGEAGLHFVPWKN